MTGKYMRSIHNNHFIVDDKDNFIQMTNKTGNKDIFDNLNCGDEIKITHDLIRELYPLSTKVYSCKLIKTGNINNIDTDEYYLLELLEQQGF